MVACSSLWRAVVCEGMKAISAIPVSCLLQLHAQQSTYMSLWSCRRPASEPSKTRVLGEWASHFFPIPVCRNPRGHARRLCALGGCVDTIYVQQ